MRPLAASQISCSHLPTDGVAAYLMVERDPRCKWGPRGPWETGV
jgi:hypothetical protein